jgi:hypothetical protein
VAPRVGFELRARVGGGRDHGFRLRDRVGQRRLRLHRTRQLPVGCIHLGAGGLQRRHGSGGRLLRLLQVRLGLSVQRVQLGLRIGEALPRPLQFALHAVTRARRVRDRGLQLLALLPERLVLLVRLVALLRRRVELLPRGTDPGLQVGERPGRLHLVVQLVRDILPGGLGLFELRRR